MVDISFGINAAAEHYSPTKVGSIDAGVGYSIEVRLGVAIDSNTEEMGAARALVARIARKEIIQNVCMMVGFRDEGMLIAKPRAYARAKKKKMTREGVR
jgi:hypothetical protein